MSELSRREKEEGIKPDPKIDAFMKSIAISGQETSLVTDYVLKVLYFTCAFSNKVKEQCFELIPG